MSAPTTAGLVPLSPLTVGELLDRRAAALQMCGYRVETVREMSGGVFDDYDHAKLLEYADEATMYRDALDARQAVQA